MKKLFIIFLVVLLLIVSGCSNQITGKVTAKLKDKRISNGETTTLEINGKNTADVATTVFFEIKPENSAKIIINYPGIMEEFLQPGETTGTKLVKIQGYTDYTSTDYIIDIYLKNKEDGKTLAQETITITVKK